MNKCSNKRDYFTNLKWSIDNLPNVYIYYLDTKATICYKRQDLYDWFSNKEELAYELLSDNPFSDKLFFKMKDGTFLQNIKILDSIDVKYVAVPITQNGYFSKLVNPKTAKKGSGYLLLFNEHLKDGLVNYLMMNFEGYTVDFLLKKTQEQLIQEIQLYY